MEYYFNNIPTEAYFVLIFHQRRRWLPTRSNRKLHPAATSLHRLTERARRLYKQEASLTRLRQYVTRWHRWLMGGLGDMVTRKGGSTRYWVYVLKQLNITGAKVRP